MLEFIRMAKVNAAVDIVKNDQSKITGWKRILCISILICGMFFNGRLVEDACPLACDKCLSPL